MTEKVNTEVEPRWDWIVIKPDKAREEGKTPAGIIVQTGMGEDVKYGTVVAIGPGKLLYEGIVVPCQSEPGDYVSYQPDVGHTFMVGQSQYLAIKDEDIIFKVKK